MNRLFILNFKNYLEAAGTRSEDLAHAAQRVHEKLGAEIILAPPHYAIASTAKNVKMPVFCQHLDHEQAGASTGFLVPEVAKAFGATGSILNHSEHRLEPGVIASLVERLRSIQMTSVVCAATPEEVEQYARLNPDFLAIEPPELIGTGRAVSKEDPSIITNSVRALKGSRSRIICGAGISSKDDVAKAIQLGSEGILVASSVVKAPSWYDKIYELASGMA